MHQAVVADRHEPASIPRVSLPALPSLLLLLIASLTFAGNAPMSSADLDLSIGDLEPSIKQKQHSNRTVEEYRANDNLYMVKVTPKVGSPYYLVDPDGSGDMEMRRGSNDIEAKVPKWTLHNW